jgi:hypothetical protein
MSHFFVSYSRHDRKKLNFDKLFNDLRAAGVRLWLVPDDVPAGVDWADVKEEALARADGVLYVSSRPLTSTPIIEQELLHTQQLGKPIITALLQLTSINQIPPELNSTIVDFRKDYDRALKTLIERLPDASIAAQPVKETAPKSKGYVFISYAEEDTAFVMKLREFLKTRAYGYWDYQDSDRNYHGLLFLELEEVIKNAAATISVMSPDWKRSKWAAKEFMFSEEVGTPIFLLKVQAMEPTLVTAGIPYIDFTRDEQKGFDKLDNELRRKGLL